MRRIGLDPVRHFRPPPADRSLGARLGVLVAVGLLLFAILGFRLWFLQILSGESYEVLAMNNRVREVEIEAARGVIYDRDGEALVENRAGLSVAILPMDLKNEAVVVRRLADVLSIPEEDIWSKLDQRENDPYREIIIKEDVPEVPVVTYLKEHSLEFPGRDHSPSDPTCSRCLLRGCSGHRQAGGQQQLHSSNPWEVSPHSDRLDSPPAPPRPGRK